MDEKKISICIPTYNRKIYLEQLLKSIAEQINDSNKKIIQVCISDNASTDGTEDLIYQWRQKSQIPFVYSKNEHNMGFDLNIIKAISLAEGKYCWFMGDDDALVPGAINRILSEIELGYDIYLCNRIECLTDLEPYEEKNWLLARIKDTVYDFSSEETSLRYFEHAQSLGAVFSFLSSIIVSRVRLEQIVYNDRFINSGYYHVYYLLSLINKNSKLKYIKSHLILCRLDNDNITNMKDVIQRYLLDYNGYLAFADYFYKQDKKLYNSFLKILTRERNLRGLVYLALNIRTNTERKNIYIRLKKIPYTYLTRFIFLTCSIVPLRTRILSLLRRVKK